MTSEDTSSKEGALPDLPTCTVAVIGLGYVGLPLAVEFGKPQKCCITGIPLRRKVIGFDINQLRIDEIRKGKDYTNETNSEEINLASLLDLSSEPRSLANADVFIVTVPTPIDAAKKPDLSPLEKASKTVGRALKGRLEIQKDSKHKTIPIVIYESTVYPGATEEICVGILERESGLVFNKDFYCGYSPERINPGDTKHKLTSITKVTSGSNKKAAKWIDSFYASIIKAGTHLTPNIKVAEAAKVIENTQRDLNIALVNELAIIFQKLGIDTLDVLEAAGTKWNFLPFRPGLVGGHCISVDPYYLTHKSQQLGYTPEIVLAGRRINDSMGTWVVQQMVLEMASRELKISGSKVLILGLSFKENCPDLRNTRVVDVINELNKYGIESLIVDPWVDANASFKEYGLNVLKEIPNNERFDGVIATVAHIEFKNLPTEKWKILTTPKGVIVDLKGIVPRDLSPMRL